MLSGLIALIIPGLVAFLAAFIFTPLVLRFALRFGAVSKPGGRHIHQAVTPKLGGLAIAMSVLLVVIGVLLTQPNQLQFVGTTVFGIDRNLFGVLLGAIILVITGVIDDRYDLNPWLKLLLQAVAAGCVVAFGVNIHWLSNPFGGSNIVLGAATYLLVPAWLLLMINTMNWFDGLDGLTSGLSVIASIAMIFLALDPIVNQPATALLAAIVAGATLGFLPYNWHPAKIFLGDTGSMFLGYMLGVFAIISGAKLATAALVLGIPILDAFWVIGRRLLTGQSPMKADKRHLHHRFLNAGFSQRATVLILYAISILFGMIALTTGTHGKVQALIWLFVVVVVLGIGLFILEKRRKV
jgi:UDP-GlcNAc:undecaprenyl-phosphate GlcNAc-1-phosphate transferase